MNTVAVAGSDSSVLRSKRLVTTCISKDCQLNLFTERARDFVTRVFRCGYLCHRRKRQHTIKLSFLDAFYERELHTLKVYYFKNYKLNNNKMITMRLEEIKEHHKQAVISEYFKLCRMVYRCRMKACMASDLTCNSLDSMKKLFTEDATFGKQIKMVYSLLLNVFQGTDSRLPLRNEPLKIMTTHSILKPRQLGPRADSRKHKNSSSKNRKAAQKTAQV